MSGTAARRLVKARRGAPVEVSQTEHPGLRQTWETEKKRWSWQGDGEGHSCLESRRVVEPQNGLLGGLFAGVAFEGATLREDLDDNAALYGKTLENRATVTKGVRAPKAAAKLLELLNRYSAGERTD